jgi:hypothetical protein
MMHAYDDHRSRSSVVMSTGGPEQGSNENSHEVSAWAQCPLRYSFNRILLWYIVKYHHISFSVASKIKLDC